MFGISLRDYKNGNINISIGDKKDGYSLRETEKLNHPHPNSVKNTYERNKSIFKM